MIRIEDFYCKDYWLYIQAKDTATLEDLDSFLRDIWLECCGHLSVFIIDDVVYNSYVDSEMTDMFSDFSENMLNYKFKDLINETTVFRHDYDFGSTTSLKLTVVEKYKGIETINKITLLARNIKQYECVQCGNTACYIFLDYESETFEPFCEGCAKSYEKNEDDIFIIVNSPRMGVCGYTGSL
ncbi:hypothetical protein COC69_01160 [Bacillus cereus]|uniref:Uncharacterized protein n=1 Tax=Bacillus cereus TaxID=1396 RepID=A0A9X7CSU6_BACCE|nr:hypothetical protein [Bacillus cereus]PGS83953.1 hypothetical protein COC69_01160 [Bacillus cereus]